MAASDKNVFLFGTDEPPDEPRLLSAGPLSAIVEAGTLRAICWGERELVRQIDFPIRDADWGSVPPQAVTDHIHVDDNGFRYERSFDVADGALHCQVVYDATADGKIRATGEATARSDFVTNRTGFTILHPLDGFAGQAVTVRHASGQAAQTTMPERIKPSQPIKDIAGLAFDLDGITLDIAFDGEVFEMEDQRNWSDASYKTYCRPLVEPFAYVIKAGETLRQSVTISISGAPHVDGTETRTAVAIGAEDTSPLPELLLALDEGWFADVEAAQLLQDSGLNRFLLRVTPQNADRMFKQVRSHLQATQGEIDLEIVLADDTPADAQVAEIARACRAQGIRPTRVTALPAAFLASYQPSSDWPMGLQPSDSASAARAAFPDALIGVGKLTNFTELNRCPPTEIAADFITHTNSATIHAADDASIMQTLETLPHICRCARALRPDCTYRLGLTAIAMRTNPYGSGTSPNPDQRRLTMTVADPRARALFGAAWAVGALAATEGQAVEAITLAAPAGPFGIISAPQEEPRPWFDDHPQAVIYPVYHALRALSALHRRLTITGLPKEVAGVAARGKDTTRLVLANLTGKPQRIDLPARRQTVLDETSFEAAVQDPRWVEHSQKHAPAGPLTLPAYATAFLDLGETYV